MDNMHEPSRFRGAVFEILRGLLVGIIGVAAIAVWAINFEPVFLGKASDGVFVMILRVVICDAIPLAILCAIYQGISRNDTLAGILRGILSTVFWFRARPSTDQATIDPWDDH
jgi:hypothetical protein